MSVNLGKLAIQRLSMQYFHFWKWKTNCFWCKYCRIKIFGGTSLHDACNKPQKQRFADVLQNSCSYEYSNIHGEKMCWSLFHKFTDLFSVFRLNTERYWYREILVFRPNTGRRPATLLKRNSNQHRCFPVNVMKFLRTAFSTGCRWLFLKPQAYLETSQRSVRELFFKKKVCL